MFIPSAPRAALRAFQLERPSMSNGNRRRVLAGFGGLLALAIAVAAVAYWTGGGSGTGTADVGTNGSVTLTGTVAPGSAPGISEPVSFTAANPSGSPIQVTKVHLVSVSADGAHAGCVTDDFSMADVIEDHEVPAEATNEALPNDGSLVYANTAVSQDECKNATLTLTLSSS
jgi:hypothetical protein